ncbi:DUF4493 domain-containing protein [Flammeovirga kamogawensis]|uniref:DUF4493 domain-containing protein n=1 Tax=Flammeovirga kamogawensis TaxID=373891 RepID=A0ABX8H4A6_9BACT|nr:DUF4493 domain-containing protein [Flammeovirga kamogawensis]MBB6461825.1 hypothetical protein [Flammeovirga kamogawensis]QWG10741.1 DUF4493 domain-containing protein [Flammeovirga kamogawensis]TRX63843.1 DUF4493 domain-containing protein [Flammeovirga kamogawensis]
MNIKSYSYILISAITLFLIGCNILQGETEIPSAKGSLALNMSGDDTLIPVSFLREKDAIDISSYRVEIRDENGVLVKFYEKYADVPEKIDLRKGIYTIKAASDAQHLSAGFECPYYEGTTTVEIKSGEVVEAKVICSLINMKVHISYSADFGTYFTAYEAVVSNGMNGGELTFSKDEARSAYFLPNLLTITLKVTAKDGITKFQKEFLISDVAAKDFHNIEFSPYIGVGDASLNIKIDDKMNEKDVVITGPSTLPPDALAIEGDGFDIDKEFEINKGETPVVKVNIEAPKLIKNLIVRIDSKKLTKDELLKVGLDDTFDLATVDPTSSLGANLKNLGFISDDPIQGKDRMVFNLSQFMPMLALFGTETHRFHIKVIDQDGVEIEKTLTIKINA